MSARDEGRETSTSSGAVRERPAKAGSCRLSVRQGAPWTFEDHVKLVDALRTGLDEIETANALTRTRSAIRQRARMLVDPDFREAGEYAIDALRRALTAEEEYDWEPRVRRAAAANGAHYWDREDTEALFAAWTDETPLPVLAARVGVTEQEIVRQFIALDVAATTPETTSRLGCTPQGVVDLRSRLATDRSAAEAWVLVLTVLGNPKVSLHASREEAEALRDREIEALGEGATGTGATTVWWCIANGVPGSGDGGGEPDAGEQLVVL